MNPRNTTDELVSVKIEAVEDVPDLAWAVGLEVSLPIRIAEALPGYRQKRIIISRARVADTAVCIDGLRMRAAFTPSPPVSARLPFSYQLVPLWFRTAIGRALGHLQRRRSRSWAAYPRWPLDLSADFVADLSGAAPSPFSDGRTPVLLTHDIDTAEGLENLVGRFLPIEESIGARSANYVVPFAWPLDHGLLTEISARGHELGIHGYDHSNRTPFAASAQRKSRIEAARPLVERYGMTGYRAPSLLRTQELLADLGDLYSYDSSIPTSGGLFPVPNNGCATARPFLIGKLVEIPLTMPRDGSLKFLGYRPHEIISIWHACARQIAASGGIVTLLTHCETRFSGDETMLSMYRRFLEDLASDDRYRFSTSAEILHVVGNYSHER